MTSTWYVWKCSNHGAVRHTNKEYKCKRLDCNLNSAGYVKFNHEADTWYNFTDLSDSDVELVKLIEPRSRAEYKSILEAKSDNELAGIQAMLIHNVESNVIGPIFHSEILSVIKERIKNVDT
tara:strand:- start:547 stop:912 length:366 start_codon:yes stop_codon:yes gene_type:complete